MPREKVSLSLFLIRQKDDFLPFGFTVLDSVKLGTDSAEEALCNHHLHFNCINSFDSTFEGESSLISSKFTNTRIYIIVITVHVLW